MAELKDSTINGNPVWHAGNDGNGSGLDADTLDGQHASYFYSPANPPNLASVPYGTTAQRPTGVTGSLYFNTSTGSLEVYNGTNWGVIYNQIGLSPSNPAPSAAYIKSVNPTAVSGVYWLYSSQINGGNPFQCYCDFTIDGGIGYAVYFQKYFESADLSNGSGFEHGPSFTEMSANTTTGTASYNTEYNLYPNLMPTAYNNGAGASRMIVFNRTNSGYSEGGIVSSTYKYFRMSNISASNMTAIWKGFASAGQYTASFVVHGNTGDYGNSGTVYIQSGHGSSGGVYQWTSVSGAVNSYVVFEYKPVGQSENSAYTDPNHYWMVDNGVSGSAYFRFNPEYGNLATQPNAASGTFGIRWGGIAIY